MVPTHLDSTCWGTDPARLDFNRYAQMLAQRQMSPEELLFKQIVDVSDAGFRFLNSGNRCSRMKTDLEKGLLRFCLIQNTMYLQSSMSPLK